VASKGVYEDGCAAPVVGTEFVRLKLVMWPKYGRRWTEFLLWKNGTQESSGFESLHTSGTSTEL